MQGNILEFGYYFFKIYYCKFGGGEGRVKKKIVVALGDHATDLRFLEDWSFLRKQPRKYFIKILCIAETLLPFKIIKNYLGFSCDVTLLPVLVRTLIKVSIGVIYRERCHI